MAAERGGKRTLEPHNTWRRDRRLRQRMGRVDFWLEILLRIRSCEQDLFGQGAEEENVRLEINRTQSGQRYL